VSPWAGICVAILDAACYGAMRVKLRERFTIVTRTPAGAVHKPNLVWKGRSRHMRTRIILLAAVCVLVLLALGFGEGPLWP